MKFNRNAPKRTIDDGSRWFSLGRMKRYLVLFSFFFSKIESPPVSAGSKHSFDELYKFRVIRVERDICIGGRVENCSGTIHATNSKLFI